MPTTRNPRRGDDTVISKLDAERARQQRERQAAEMELQRQMNAEKEKRQAEKKKRDEERKQEEELRNKMEDQRRKQEESALKDKIREALVSPEEFIRHPMVNSDGDDSIDRLLQSGGADMDIDIEDVDTDETQEGKYALRSPPKKSARFSNVKKARSKPSTSSGRKELSKQAPPKIGKRRSAKEERIKNPAAQACSSLDNCGVIDPAPGRETGKLLHQRAEGITSKRKDSG
jgi:hypothetical protein